MEVIVLGLLCDLMGALGLLKADEAFESVKGGIVEEFVEEFIEGVLGIRLFINKRKTYVKVLAKRAAEYLGNLSEEEIATLREFFRTHKAQIKTKKGKIKQVAVEFEVPAKEQEKGEVKATLKKLAKELKKLYAQEKHSQEATIHYVTVEEALESLFVLQENEKYPETLKGFIAIVITHVHEVSYLALSEDDRDLAKVFQYMLDENTEALKRWFGKEVVTPDGFSSMKGDLAELKETLLLIMQQHESGALASAATVGKARKDPFCFAKLVCPDCHATGEYIVRKGNRTYCKKCGSAHDITENIEDLKKLLEETKQELAEKLDLQGRGVSEIGGKVDVIAQKMVTTEFFEQVFAEMKRENADSAEKTVEEIMLTKAENKQFAEEMKKRVDARLEEESKKLQAVLDSVFGEISKSNKKLERNGLQLEYIERVLDSMISSMDSTAILLQDQMIFLGKKSDDILDRMMTLDVKVDAMKAYLEESGHKVFESVKEVKAYLEESGHTVFEKFENVEGLLKGMISEIKTLKGSTKDKDLSEIEKFLTERLKKEQTVDKDCPCCERLNSTFKPNGTRLVNNEPKAVDYRCEYCGFRIPSEDIHLDKTALAGKELKVEGYVVSMWTKFGQNRRRIFWDYDKALHENSDKKRIKVRFDRNSYTAWRNEGVISFDSFPRDLEEPEEIILVATHSIEINECMIEKFLETVGLENVKEIKLGNNVELTSALKSKLQKGKTSGRLAGWRYDKDSKTMRR